LNIKNGNLARFLLVPNKKLKKYLDRIEIILYIKNMKQEHIEQYNSINARLKSGELTTQQWNDLSLLLLQQIMLDEYSKTIDQQASLSAFGL